MISRWSSRGADAGDPGRGGGRAHRPRKRFGQHFLTDPSILSRIAGALDARAGEHIVEIGPGPGALTHHLLATGARVTAVEIDRDLAARLRHDFDGEPRFTLVEGDVLEVPLGELGGAGYALAGNIPYNITTPILFHALRPPPFTRAVLLLQREVAERLVAAPGSEAYGALTVNVQAQATVELVFGVPSGAFTPPPRVASAVVRLRTRAEPIFPPAAAERCRRLVVAAFGMRRKQMRRVLREIAGLEAAAAEVVLGTAGIEPAARPEVLTPDDYARIAAVLAGPG